MLAEAVGLIERRIGKPLPAAYRAFLLRHQDRYLDPNWLVRPAETIPGSGPEEYLRSLATAQGLLDQGLIGEPDESMLVIGEIEPGGYLYLNVGPQRFGALFARFPFNDPKFYLVATDFGDLLQRSRPDPLE